MISAICSLWLLVTIISFSNAHKNPLVTDQVYLTISIGGEEVGRIEIGLFGEIVPKTVRNFIELATHKNGYGYRGSSFHRIDEYYYIHGGAFKYGNRSEGTSIYGRYFPSENFKLKHYGSGWVSMSNAGIDKNGSQFFIVTRKLKMFDNKFVVFGKVLKGMPIVRKIQSLEISSGSPPKEQCIIVDSGLTPLEKPFVVSKDDALYNDPVTVNTAHAEL